MEIIINGKNYILNEDVRFGVLMELDSKPDDPKTHIKFYREFLIPTPTPNEIYNFRQSDTKNIFQCFNEMNKEKIADIKKKRSQ